MIAWETFLIGLMVVSTLTSLVTEAVKTILTEHNRTYHANTLSGIIAVCLSLVISIGYAIIAGMSFSAQIVVCTIALMFMSWLCAMVGYDKVLSQFKTIKGADTNAKDNA